MAIKIHNSKRFLVTTPILLSMAFAAVWGCTKPKFAKDPSFNQCQNSGINCVTANGKDTFNFSYSGAKGKVDILIVDDNSASMSYEQARLADRFINFIQNLESRNIDYRIAITTTDVADSNNTARTINQNGALQNGNLISFSDGSKFITPDSGSLTTKVNLFNNAIKRPETLSCESFILGWSGSRDSSAYDSAYLTNCPSGDERGIYAATLTVQNNPSSFIRSDANLSIIFLSDEDERSQLYYWNEPGFELSTNDQPSNLVSTVRSQYPSKQLSIHSIIVADDACLSSQSGQTGGLVSSSFGNKYAEASRLVGGVVGDICASSTSYTNQLGQISASIASQMNKVAIVCKDTTSVSNLSVNFVNNVNSISYTIQSGNIVFSSALPAGTTANITYSCPIL